jgi:membrane protein YqaA with SNARE-associated domain
MTSTNSSADPAAAAAPAAPAGALAVVMGPVRRLYDWVLSWATSPLGPAALFVLSFVESSFFPIPPDPLLIALCLGAVSRSLAFAAICTVASVLGGLFGYWIGMSAFEAVGLPVLELYGKVDDFEVYRETFRREGNLAVLIAAITPVPYKLVTITAGAAGMSVPAFVGASVVGRGLRFFALAALIAWKGEQIAGFIERHFERLMVVFGVLLVAGFLAFRFLLH